MSLYTFMTFIEDAAIYQVRAENLDVAIETWVRKVVDPDYYEMNVEEAKDFIKEMLEYEEPVMVNDRMNVWCMTHLLHDEVMLIYIIKTEED